ncbi:phosphatidylethanolamine-binding protein 4 isoform X2 [Latimeria chalumnae]|uniref:Phosphatidylethanolamine binding protein 4 n=1 Tax=Latimeria chalumnae TaxID=7897 RepID=H3B0D7_LATCH|nr:PREDICTED: phosphatidylethanolamine-binding protein 4 isoform X2 [Latimeria chalumnae]|eukprot:XP_005992654.1 PREDICTED: phosphatidylethanolamine-binding protein 4 isoform X2 [Latimeria chalumnae]
MKWPSILLLFMGVFVLVVQEVVYSVEDEVCYFEKLNEEDSKFCRGKLWVIFPGLGDVSCRFIPECKEFRKMISTEWLAPVVQYSKANENENYVMIMVDPDAPRRDQPRFRYWRHWLVTDILGKNLKAGVIKGKTLSEYRRPTPPQNTGYHRYQFLIYSQPPNTVISLSPEEKESFGGWNVSRFVARFNLGKPVAKTQFMTRSFK